jgi:predicted dehydrogenase
MGRAHSHAYLDVARFFDLPSQPIMRAACDMNPSAVDELAKRFGWLSTETDWKKLIQREDISLIDISTPTSSHMPIAIAAAKAGKHVICEKPLARSVDEALRMLEAVHQSNVIHMVAFNYRRVPAIALTRKIISDGGIGPIRHFNAVYYQEWSSDENVSFSWRHDIQESGSGELCAHIIDLARYLVGEFESVTGFQETIIKERPLSNRSGKRRVTTEDEMCFLARFCNGAIGSFTGSRIAPGYKNHLRFEVIGAEGSIAFNLEHLNEIEFYSNTQCSEPDGFRKVMVTEPSHPYMNAWWPAGHIIGWEHAIIHEIYDLLVAISENKPIQPNFFDGLQCQQVIESVVRSLTEERWMAVPAINLR